MAVTHSMPRIMRVIREPVTERSSCGLCPGKHGVIPKPRRLSLGARGGHSRR